MRPFAHFKTITRHRWLVLKYCFRLGLYRQGLIHDLSKYSPTEFWRGAKYYSGVRSPNFPEREEHGFSLAWLHHKGRNKHHFDYWLDYILQPDGTYIFGGCKMPMKYVAEMFCDRLAANKIYAGEGYTDDAPYEYFMRTRGNIPMHPETCAEIESMLLVLKNEGEDEAFRFVKERLKESK